jgi:cytoskeletal protein CcmA (bactofilin family)
MLLVCRPDTRPSVQLDEESKLGVFAKSNQNNNSLNGTGIEVKSDAASTSGKTASDLVSTLGHGMLVTGNIVCEGSLRICGRVIGDIHASQLVICEGAQVEGNIIAPDTIIDGVFKGTVHGNNVSLQSRAVVNGEIHNKSLSIDQNARFEGVSRRLEKPVELPTGVPAEAPLSPAMADANPGIGAAGTVDSPA